LQPEVTAAPNTPAPAQNAAPTSNTAPTLKNLDPRIESVRQHLDRYRSLASQGKWADAGRELDAIQSEVGR